jgi:hypothetical protein
MFEHCGAARGWHNVFGDANRKDGLNATGHTIPRRQSPASGSGHGASASRAHVGVSKLDRRWLRQGTFDIRTQHGDVRHDSEHSER